MAFCIASTAWPAAFAGEADEGGAIPPASAHVVVISTPDFAKTVFLRMGHRGSFVFAKNVVEALCLGDALPSLDAAVKGASVSDKTREIVTKLRGRVRVRYFVSGELPRSYGDLRGETESFLRTLARASGGKVVYEIVDPDAYIEAEAKRLAEERERRRMEAEARGEEYREDEEFQPFDPRNATRPRRKLSDAEKVKRDLARSGIVPLTRRDQVGKNRVEILTFYSAIRVDHPGRPPEVIPDHRGMDHLEYRLAIRLLRLTVERRRCVAFYNGQPENAPVTPSLPGHFPRIPESEYSVLVELLLQEFDVQEIALTEADPLPRRDALRISWKGYETDEEARRARKKPFDIPWQVKTGWRAYGDPLPVLGTGEQADALWRRLRRTRPHEVVGPVERDGTFYLFEVANRRLVPDCLVLAQPKELNARQVYEINRYISEGGNAVILDGRFQVDLLRGLEVSALDSGLHDLYAAWGFALQGRPVNDARMGTIPMETRRRTSRGPVVATEQIPIPSLVLVKSEEGRSPSPFLAGAGEITVPWASGIEVDASTIGRNGVRLASELLRSSDRTWRGPATATSLDQLSGKNWVRERIEAKKFDPPALLAAHFHGAFPFVFKGRPVPAWPGDEE